jgi:lipopolysaccharide export system protein LptC
MTADRIRAWLMIALLGVIMLGGFWVYEVMRRNSALNANNAKVRSDPDYFVEQFNFVRISSSGQTNYRVTGDRLTHFPREDEFEITQPRIIGIDQEKTPMTLRADRALVKQKIVEDDSKKPEDQIHLFDNVVLERLASSTNSPIRLETAFMVLYPDSEKMRTDKAVNMRTAQAEITAVGMRANNSQQKIELLSKVHMVIDKAPAQNNTQPASTTKKKI